MSNIKQEKTIFFNCIRQGIYFFLSLIFVLSLRLLAKNHGPAMFQEFGLIENIQSGLLFITTFFFAIQAKLSKTYRPLLFLLSSLCLFAFIRELDSFFDKVFPFISWKFCYLFPLVAGIYLLKHKKTLKKQFFSFCQSPAFYLMCSAMMIFIPLAQAIGNRSFISSVFPDATDVILMRRFIEESAEVLAYFLLCLSSVEFFISLIRKSK